MENIPQDTNKIREIIMGSAEAIQAEFTTTANSWPACYGTRVFCIECYLPLYDIFDTERLHRARIEDIKVRLGQLHKEFPESASEPSTEIKQEMLERLDILSSAYPPLLSEED